MGGLRLVLSARFDPRTCLELMEREHVGFWIGVPTMYWALLQCGGVRGRSCARRQEPPPLRVRRRADAARRDEAVRGDFRRAGARRVRTFRNVTRGGLQSAPTNEQTRDRGPPRVRCRHSMRRRARCPGGDRRTRRGCHPRAERDEGLLQSSGGDCRGLSRRMVPHR